MAEESVHLLSLLKCLVQCSEKAAHIAQICRSDRELFSLLIQEKKDHEKNMRFIQDFKTLADVLVQETIRWEVTKMFPCLFSNIFGEENNHFQNTLGDSIDVCVTDSLEETSNLLFMVLDERQDSANLLASTIHKKVEVDIAGSQNFSGLHVPGSRIGIWIDPIDSTSEYVHGEKSVNTCLDFAKSGLDCVCVLIGVYNTSTGLPIMGIVNQPFHTLNSISNRYQSKYFWAVCTESIYESSVIPRSPSRPKEKIVVSSFEDKNLLLALESMYIVHQVAGAGYKSLLVATGEVDLYVLSLSTLSFWDTCAPQSLLLALEGGIIDFTKAMRLDSISLEDLPSLQLKYNEKETVSGGKLYCNAGGVIAYHSAHSVISLLRYLRECAYTSK